MCCTAAGGNYRVLLLDDKKHSEQLVVRVLCRVVRSRAEEYCLHGSTACHGEHFLGCVSCHMANLAAV